MIPTEIRRRRKAQRRAKRKADEFKKRNRRIEAGKLTPFYQRLTLFNKLISLGVKITPNRVLNFKS